MASTSAASPPDDHPSLLDGRQNDMVDDLERKVGEGISVLSALETIRRKYSAENEDGCLKRLEDLKAKAENPRVVIGIVGSTGAGKSSIINALLDEERLVPTNSMRACTAVVTEISYNHDDVSRYKAEVEFISKADWEDELRLLFQDISDPQDAPTSSQDSSSDLAIAYAKLEAVYGIKKETISNHSIEQLMGQADVQTYSKTRPSEVRKKPARTTQLDDAESSATQERKVHLYPLVRVVRLNAKAEALSTGASIVDLPGTQDANAARSNVAASYMAQCSRLWVVAPITRAVDDGAARTLLGNRFKRQIQLDGSLDTLTFLCSKADDISLTEVNEYLPVSESFKEESDELESRIAYIKKELKQLKNQKKEAKAEFENATERLEKLDDLEKSEEELPMKRKRKSASNKVLDCEKTSSNESTDSEPGISSDGEVDDDNGRPVKAKMTQEEIDNERRETRRLKKAARSRKKNTDSQIDEYTEDLAKEEAEKVKLKRDFSRLCISRRNEFAKERLKDDFANGIRELDGENASLKDDDDVDPCTPLRDYEALAKSFPVFCVSARAYQKIKGRYKRDVAIEGYDEIEQTEIPQLQKHCMQLTVSARRTAALNFLNGLDQLLNSLKLYANGNPLTSGITQEKAKEDAIFLDKALGQLREDLDIAVKEIYSTLTTDFRKRVFDKFGRAKRSAIRASQNTVQDWNKPYSEGGISWNSYRAICRRNGLAKISRGEYNWNEQLAQPMLTVIGPGWELLFQKDAPRSLDDFNELCKKHVNTFTSSITSRVKHRPGYHSISPAIESQLKTYRASLEEASAIAKDVINQNQREASRTISIPIKKVLESTYGPASETRGKGMYRMMKDAVSRGVQESSSRMFQKAANQIEKQLQGDINKVRDTLKARISHIFEVIRGDYHVIFAWSQKAEDAEDAKLKAEITDFLNGVTLSKPNNATQTLGNKGVVTKGRTPSAPEPQDVKVKEEGVESIKAEAP